MNEVVAFGFAVTEFFRHLVGLVTDRTVLTERVISHTVLDYTKLGQ